MNMFQRTTRPDTRGQVFSHISSPWIREAAADCQGPEGKCPWGESTTFFAVADCIWCLCSWQNRPSRVTVDQYIQYHIQSIMTLQNLYETEPELTCLWPRHAQNYSWLLIHFFSVRMPNQLEYVIMRTRPSLRARTIRDRWRMRWPWTFFPRRSLVDHSPNL